MFITTGKKQFGKFYFKTFDLTDLIATYSRSTWLGIVIRELEAKNNISMLPTPDVTYFLMAIALVRTNESLDRYLALPLHKVARPDVVALFRGMELLVETKPMMPATQARTSMRFRKWMIELPPHSKFADDVSRHKLFFKTKLKGRYSPRETLSNHSDHSYEGELANPTDAMPHATTSELRALIDKRMDLDLRRVVDACMDEIKYWGKIRRQLDELSSIQICDDALTIAIELYTRPLTPLVQDRAKNISPECLLAACAKISTDPSFATKIHPTKLSGPFFLKLLELVLGINSERLNGIREGHVILMRQRMHSIELTAAFILILTNTGWNADATRCLEVTGISSMEGGYAIQGFKGKSDDHTPIIQLDAEQKPIIKVIDQLLHFNKLQQELGVIRKGDGRLWFSWRQSACSPMTEQIVSFNLPMQVMFERYSLRPFSLDQIRTHVLHQIALRTNDVSELSRRGAHRFLNTSLGYTDQIIFQTISKSANLEFQRRLENTIKWQMEKNGEQLLCPSIERYVDERLFVPLGDGTTCGDLSRPPDLSWLYEGTCDKKRCHQGNGCVQNKVILDNKRIEEVFRLERYYVGNWRRLHERNIAAFELFHGPAILFNFALASFVRNSLFWPEVQSLLSQRGLHDIK